MSDTLHASIRGAQNDARWQKTSPRDPLFQQSRDFAARRDWEALPFEPIELAPRPRILIVKLSAIGDCLIASPLAQALRERFPDAHLAWAVQEKAKVVVEGNPFLDEILVQEKGLAGFVQILKRVKKGRFDAVLDVQGAFKSAPLAWASGAKWRVVSSRAQSIARRAANRIVPIEGTPPHALEQYLRVASALGIEPQTPRRLIMEVGDEPKQWGAQFWAENNAPSRVVALNPASARPLKAWPAAHFARLADSLEQNGIRTLFVGGPNDVEVVQNIIASMQHQPLSAAGKTNLRQLGALLQRCALLVSADTGPMHIAAGVGTPVVALFGPTDPRRTGPTGPNHLVLARDLPCRPCFQQPTCDRVQCLTEMQPEDVFDSVMRILATDVTDKFTDEHR
jgi:lipopolysaccharide heptosyltransferase II